MPPRTANVGGANPEFILREFQGMNTLAAREAIDDNEFYWCENAIPLAPGNLVPVNNPTAALVTVAGETGSPSYSTQFNVSGTDFVFAVWKNSGNGWIVNLTTFAMTHIISGLTSGQTTAVQYGNYGLLILDPTGYWDWNVTTPATLTPQNNAVANATLVYQQSVNGGTNLRQIMATGAGTGGAFQTLYQVTSATLNAAGTGYSVGDTLTLTDGSPITPATIVVASIGAGGAITGITLTGGGSYPGPTSSVLTATGPTGNTVGGGSLGTGATFTVKITAASLKIISRGTGYANGDGVSDQLFSGSFHTVDSFAFTVSGVIGGIAIAVYAGRVWLASGRVIYFTDINSYNSFGGAGGSFTINDAYLHNNITALFSANNYLYIFGDSSIDALSNVTITAGVTSFSRINITASVGTSTPTSVFSYYRAIVFYHSSGFYLLAGATPEKISEKITGIIQQIVPSFTVYGAQVLVQTELCAAMLFTFTDIFTQGGAQRSLLALFFRGRWWVASLPGLNVQAMVSIPGGNPAYPVAAGTATIYAWAGPSLYQAFNPSQNLATWLLKTKLWDGGAPLKEKQSINAAIAGLLAGLGGSGSTIQVDTEKGSSPVLSVPAVGSPAGYQLLPLTANEGSSQYLGLTVSGNANTTRLDLVALRGKTDRDFLQ